MALASSEKPGTKALKIPRNGLYFTIKNMCNDNLRGKKKKLKMTLGSFLGDFPDMLSYFLE